jgi:hypothetical protein
MKYPLYEVVLSIVINVLTLGIIWFVLRGAHVEMTMENSEKYGYSSFRNWKRAFDKQNWICQEQWPHSLFGDDREKYGVNYFHADIIKIGGVGYVLSTVGFLLANLYVKKFIQKQRLIQFSSLNN